jgi:hypothetical protein
MGVQRPELRTTLEIATYSEDNMYHPHGMAWKYRISTHHFLQDEVSDYLRPVSFLFC